MDVTRQGSLEGQVKHTTEAKASAVVISYPLVNRGIAVNRYSGEIAHCNSNLGETKRMAARRG